MISKIIISEVLVSMWFLHHFLCCCFFFSLNNSIPINVINTGWMSVICNVHNPNWMTTTKYILRNEQPTIDRKAHTFSAQPTFSQMISFLYCCCCYFTTHGTSINGVDWIKELYRMQHYRILPIKIKRKKK